MVLKLVAWFVPEPPAGGLSQLPVFEGHYEELPWLESPAAARIVFSITRDGLEMADCLIGDMSVLVVTLRPGRARRCSIDGGKQELPRYCSFCAFNDSSVFSSFMPLDILLSIFSCLYCIVYINSGDYVYHFHFPFSIYLCDAQPHRLNDVLLSSDL